MDEAEIEATKRFRQREMWALTPEERLEKAEALYQQAMQTLRQSPQALKSFHARNRRKRRVVPEGEQ